MTEKTSLSSNIFLFYGEDDFSLRREVERWKTEFAKKYSASAVTFLDAANFDETNLVKNLQNSLAPSLFASKKLIIIRDCLPTKADHEKLTAFLLDLPNQVSQTDVLVFWQTSRPDGRLKFTKQFKALVKVKEFNLPHGRVLDSWIMAMAKTLGVSINERAADRLAEFLGRDLYEEKKAGGRVVETKEAFDLWQVYSELLKLSASGPIDLPQVEALVKPKIPDSVFNLTDQVVARNQKGTFQAFENFLSTQTADEKTSLIKILALLSDQIRSLLVVSLLQKQGLSNEDIAEKLGWSSGRVFITAKNLRNASEAKLKQLLQNLLLIDNRIKSSDTNNKLDVNLFLAQATA